jgi:hypothetical protein
LQEKSAFEQSLARFEPDVTPMTPKMDTRVKSHNRLLEEIKAHNILRKMLYPLCCLGSKGFYIWVNCTYPQKRSHPITELD